MWDIVLSCALCLISINLTTVSSYDLSGAISGNSMAAIPLGDTLGDGDLDLEGVCWGPGVACQNCTNVVMCIALPMGWLKIPLPECEGGETCNAGLGGCSKRAVPECNQESQDYEHICEQVGIFPDAFDCRKFHTCMPLPNTLVDKPAEHRSALCPRHYGYDAKSAQCSIKLQHGQCETPPVPECTSLAQMGPLPSSPNHYYLCLKKDGKLQPRIFICPNGWFFWGGYCKPEPNPAVHVEYKTEEKAAEPKIDADKAKHVDEQEVNTSAKETTEIEPINTEGTVRKSSFRSIFDMYPAEKPTEYPKDNFLADKYDFSHLDNVEESYAPYGSSESINSWEQ